jgi:Flp pilus assembly pilin Flp
MKRDFSWVRKRKGQGMVEYILIIAVVITIVFVAYKALAKKVKKQFENAAKIMQKADKG